MGITGAVLSLRPRTWLTWVAVGLVMGWALMTSFNPTPAVPPGLAEDHYATDEDAHGAESGVARLRFHQDDSSPIAYVNADIAVDDDFVTLTGSDWRLAAPRLVEGANDLLAAVHLQLKVNGVRQWRSEDAVDAISKHLAAAERQIPSTPGHLFLAIIGRNDFRYDGWARRSEGAAIVEFYADDPLVTHSLIAHEVGHLLGAKHHADDEDCTGDGCLMEQKGYDHLETWCEHHQDVIRDIVSAGLDDASL